MDLFRRTRQIILNLEEESAGTLFKTLSGALNAKPKELTVVILGGKLSADDCLTLWDLMTCRSKATRLVVEAKGSIYDAAILLLLAADEIRVRPGVWLELRGVKDHEDEDDEDGFFRFRSRRKSSVSETPWETDLKTAYQVVDRYLPVKEFVGRRVGLEMTLQEHGLMLTKNEEQSFQNLFKAA